MQHFPQLLEATLVQQIIAWVHPVQTQVLPASDCPPEPLLLLDAPLDEPLEPPEEPLDEPLEDPLPDPPPLELEPVTLAHSLPQCAVVHVISLSPALRSAAEQLHALVHSMSEPPRSKHPMYVSHPVLCAQPHHSPSQWLAMQSSQRWLARSGVHAGASGLPPLDELLASTPELLPEDPPVDASVPPPDAKGAPPQSAASARGASAMRRAEARLKRSITKPA